MSSLGNNFLMELWQRRFFYYFATFLGIAWVLIQFTNFLTDRYNLTDIWVERVGLFLILLTPTIILFIYNHGKPGPDEWKPYEKNLYPLNIILALVAPMLLVSGHASPSTTQIQLTTETGDTITREVHNIEHTYRIQFFPLEMKGLDQEESWIKEGIPFLSKFDLEQDMRFYSTSLSRIQAEIRDAGYDSSDKVPYSVLVKISNDLYGDYFVDGSLSKTDDNKYEATINLNKTSSAKQIESETFVSDSFYDIVDNISNFIKGYTVGEQTEMSEKVLDLPASDIISTNPEVLKLLMKTQNNNEEDFEENISQTYDDILKTTQIDPNCAACYQQVIRYKMVQNVPHQEDMEKMLESSRNAPERLQFEYKYLYYLQKNEVDKAMKLCEMWKKLYPRDSKPYYNLIYFNNVGLNKNKAIKVGEEALANGIGGSIYVDLAKLYADQKNTSKADSLIKIFEKKYPVKAKKNTVLSDVYTSLGDYKRAGEILDEKMLLNPNDRALINKLINLKLKTGEIDVIPDLLQNAYRVSKDLNDTLSVQKTEMQYYKSTGQLKKAIATEEVYRNKFFKIRPKIAYIQELYQNSSMFSLNEDYEAMKNYLELIYDIYPLGKQLTMGLNQYVLSVAKEDTEDFLANYEKYKSFQTMSMGENGALMCDAFKGYLTKDYNEAFAKFKEFSDKTGNDLVDLGRMVAKAARLQDDEKLAQEFFANVDQYHSYNLDSNIEYALFLIEKEDKKNARKVLDRILQIGKYADDDVVVINEANELITKLQ